MTTYHPPSHDSSDETNVAIGALADGLANTAISDTDVDDNSTGYVGGLGNGDNRNNDQSSDNDNNGNTTNTTSTSSDNDVYSDNDNYTKTYSDDDNTAVNTAVNTAIDIAVSDNDSYTKTYSDNDVISDNDTSSDNDVWQWSDSSQDNDNTTSTSSSQDNDFATLHDVKGIDNLGIAGEDLSYDIGDDFSFNLDVSDVLNGGAGDAGFNIVQANNLADQDVSYGMKMMNEGAENHLSANGGWAYGDDGLNIDANCGDDWDLGAGDDLSATSTADASAILANSGFHQELIQGANIVSNAVDITVTGGNSTVTDVGQDHGA